MEENYSHTEIILSDLDHKNEEFLSETPSWTREKSTILTLRMTRFLLAVLCLILLCGLTALGVLYVEKSNMPGSLKAQNSSASLFSLELQMAEKHTNMSDFLEARNRNLSASLASVQQKLAEEISVANSLEDQNRNLSASLSSLQQKLAEKNSIVDSLEAQNRNITVSLSSVEQKLTKEISIANSLEDQNRNLSASLSSLQQKLADVEKNNTADSLEARNRNLSASMLSLQQELAANAGCIWTRHLGRAYYFSSQRMSWMQSRDYCISKGATLVIIKSEQKQSFLLDNIRETHWIGLSDLGTEGQWRWVDDTPISPTEIQFWHTRPNGEHEPDNWTGGDPTGEDCAALGYSGGNLEEWFDASCTLQKRFVCEK